MLWIQGLRRLNGRLLIHAAEGLFGLGLVDVGALDGHKVGRCSQACDVLPCGLGVVIVSRTQTRKKAGTRETERYYTFRLNC